METFLVNREVVVDNIERTLVGSSSPFVDRPDIRVKSAIVRYPDRDPQEFEVVLWTQRQNGLVQCIPVCKLGDLRDKIVTCVDSARSVDDYVANPEV